VKNEVKCFPPCPNTTCDYSGFCNANAIHNATACCGNYVDTNGFFTCKTIPKGKIFFVCQASDAKQTWFGYPGYKWQTMINIYWVGIIFGSLFTLGCAAILALCLYRDSVAFREEGNQPLMY